MESIFGRPENYKHRTIKLSSVTINANVMWAQIVNILIGIGIMVAPAMCNFNKIAADNNHIVGPLVLTFAIISLWEINRNVRRFNIVTGAWLVFSPFLLGFGASARITDILSGVAVIVFSVFKAKINNRYGGGWSSLFQKQPMHLKAAEQQDSNNA
ncbi:SPW repeat domain-containing protein [Segetibacter koreensis]|uniref:SPW repeat domain-containing protein n=1 Tax=Segetibacter koreensis TaxID=398037 RepID=UPI000367A9A9|nr:SPW repeat protein [Segetibacter koreensis]